MVKLHGLIGTNHLKNGIIMDFFLKKVLSSINGIIIYKWDYLYINLTPPKNESDICGAKLDQNGVESSRLGVKHLITILLMGKEIM